MDYIHSQLLSLVREDYSDYEIAKELELDNEVLTDLVSEGNLEPSDIFTKAELLDWAIENGLDYKEN